MKLRLALGPGRKTQVHFHRWAEQHRGRLHIWFLLTPLGFATWLTIPTILGFKNHFRARIFDPSELFIHAKKRDTGLWFVALMSEQSCLQTMCVCRVYTWILWNHQGQQEFCRQHFTDLQIFWFAGVCFCISYTGPSGYPISALYTPKKFVTQPDSILKIIGWQVTRNVGYYSKFRVLYPAFRVNPIF